jgi:ubiquinone/menaquinone biosynthesis C-methylase UbiE
LYELYFVSNLIPFTESLLARLQETGRLNLKVLDVASGTGAATLCLLRNGTAFQLVSATDFSKEMLDILGNLHPVLI